MWAENPAFSTRYSFQDAGTDNVRAFGVTQKATSQLKVGRMIMMGDKYWYALHKGDSDTLLPVMNAKLSQHYQIFDNINQQELTAMPVKIFDKGKHFYTDFCLRYTNPTAQELV
ncbi:hypothetical protein [Kingella negevensis]|nr:hypothetical protein [Kingella negevensis]MDK4689134.1 hypothetical protein [Kingella negevensis]WII90715.1 hypothetical protein QEO93_09900 [Kingella negevensis]WII93494.1 hypothetical protein QEO94_01190 [Kingella negevensis]